MKPLGTIEKNTVLLRSLVNAKAGDILGFNAYTYEAGINSPLKVKVIDDIKKGERFTGELLR